MNKLDRRNMIFFGLGTVGRDMFYALEANALIYYLSNVLDLPLGGLLVVNDDRFIRRCEILWEKGTNRAEFFRGQVNKYGWTAISCAP